MNILIINSHSSLNLGDASILQQMVRQLEAVFPGAHISVATNDPRSSISTGASVSMVGSFKSWIYRVTSEGQIRYRLVALPGAIAAAVTAAATSRVLGRPQYLTRDAARRRLLEAYFGADIVVNTGGHVLTSRRVAAFSYLVIVLSSLYAALIGKPLYMFPQTIGPFSTDLHRWLAEGVLRRTGLVLVRDEELYNDAIRSKRVRDKTSFVPDAAFGFSPGDPDLGWAVLQREGVHPRQGLPTVGITVLQWADIQRDFRRQSEYEEAIKTLIRHIVGKMNGRVLLFGQAVGPSRIENDLLLARRLRDESGLPQHGVVVIEGAERPQDLLNAYAVLDLLVGTRMHSTIMAMVSNVPVVAIAYTLKKHRGLFRSVGMEEWVCDIERIDGRGLVDTFDRAWASRAEMGRHLAATIPAIRERSLQAAAFIAQHYREGVART